MSAAPRLAPHRVLVVDDSAFMRRVVAELVDDCAGFRVAGTARDGAEALRLVRALDPDVVTLDVAMPDIDGLQVLDAVMRDAPRPVVVLSGLAEPGLALRARFFSPGFPATVVPTVRSLVSFERRDLLAEPPPPGGHHLVICRNVVIYFDRPTQEALFERFHSALLPGGYLVLGKVETLLGRARSLFAPVDPRERIFRRL